MSAMHYCAVDGCAQLIRLNEHYCKNHTKHVTKRSHDVSRAPQAELYHSTNWRRTSRLFREQNPLCKKCLIEHEKDCSKPISPATSVDHVIPLRILLSNSTDGLSDEGKRLYKIAKDRRLTPYSWSNLQSLCAYHHSLKTRDEQQYYLD